VFAASWRPTSTPLVNFASWLSGSRLTMTDAHKNGCRVWAESHTCRDGRRGHSRWPSQRRQCA
jgi:hypothetical protein